MMSVTIPDDVVRATQLSPEELKREIAVLLFQKEWLTLGGAAEFAEMSYWSFQQLLASRHIPMHYDVKELEEDLATLQELNLHADR